MNVAEYNAKADAAMPEKELQEFVRKAAISLGWLYFHVHDSRHSASGFPDCVMVRTPNDPIIFAELKRQNGKLTLEQEVWLELLGEHDGVAHYVWRPSDRDTILEVLR